MVTEGRETAGGMKGGWCVPLPQCCLMVLSPQDSPDASREPMAKLSVSCVWVHCHHHPRTKQGEVGVLPNVSPLHRASSPLSACEGSATPALLTMWALTTSMAITPLRALAMKICSAPLPRTAPARGPSLRNVRPADRLQSTCLSPATSTFPCSPGRGSSPPAHRWPSGWGQLNSSCCWLQLGEGLFPGWH